ncbi:GNAT family N-acetyltransferase [Selenomonas caprae]|uniref:GNAT family N-acetyltransferase n=2 Tax=Selenomonas caprae TaxID=2606905 RepID=A0A5D6WMZ5_9FIRM|nr:GNAT family N-acetyltransferase [Selenomonas caprae]
MFIREYMEYHSDRFADCSLIILNEKNNIVALLPASTKDGILTSHGGLTFGGFVVDSKMTVELMLEIFALVRGVIKGLGIKEIIYKCIPYIYNQYPAEEDRYALWRNDAQLFRRDVSTAVVLSTPYKYQKGRKWMVARGRKSNIDVHESQDFAAFMDLENRVLAEYHQAKAVHTAEEMKLLADRFPDNIHLWVGEREGELLAGALVFVNRNVVHTQYLANSPEGRELGALDRVIDHLLKEAYAGYKYFDFGTSNEEQGRVLNKGLIGQKEGFGARAVVHDFYRWNIT